MFYDYWVLVLQHKIILEIHYVSMQIYLIIFNYVFKIFKRVNCTCFWYIKNEKPSKEIHIYTHFQKLPSNHKNNIKTMKTPGAVAHLCNTNTSGGWGGRIAWGQVLETSLGNIISPHLQTTSRSKQANEKIHET